MDSSYVYQGRSGKWMTIAVSAIVVLAVVSIAIDSGPTTAARYLPVPALIVFLMWCAYWRPAVVVDDSGVTLRNVLRTIHLPWPSIQMIDTKWALTLVTSYGKFTAWAAPSPGARSASRATADDLRGLPDSTYAAGRSVRPGDLPTTQSGHAALVVRQRWEALRDAGHLENPQLERDRPEIQWNTWIFVVVAALIVAAVAGIVL